MVGPIRLLLYVFSSFQNYAEQRMRKKWTWDTYNETIVLEGESSNRVGASTRCEMTWTQGGNRVSATHKKARIGHLEAVKE